MASASCSSDEDYHNYETDSEDIQEDSPDEYDSDYDPEKEIGESDDSDSSVKTLLASEGEQPTTGRVARARTGRALRYRKGTLCLHRRVGAVRKGLQA